MAEELCGLCNRPKAEHENFRHQFSPEGKLMGPPPKPQSRPATMPSDNSAALRLALILEKKNLISHDELMHIAQGTPLKEA